jgi:membrane protein
MLETVAVVFGNVLLCRISKALCWSCAGVTLAHALRFVLPLVLLVLIFSLLYAIIPNRRLRLQQVLPGAVFASAVWRLRRWRSRSMWTASRTTRGCTAVWAAW